MIVSIGILTTAAMMINVTDSPYNAVPDDGIDDRAAIQMAIDASIASVPDGGPAATGDEIYFPPGVYDIAPQNNGSSNNIWGLKVWDAEQPVHFRGDGAASVIRMINSTVEFVSASNFRLFDIRASPSVHFSDLKLDGNNGSMTVPTSPKVEQFHLLHVSTSTVAVDNVYLVDSYGDGIKAAGTDTSVRLTNSFVSGHSRNGVTCNTGCVKIAIHQTRFDDINDTAIDFEPNTGGAQAIITDNFIDMSVSPVGIAASLSGSGGVFASEMVFSDNVVVGRMVSGAMTRTLINNNSFRLQDNTITTLPCLYLPGGLNHVSVSNNTIDCKDSIAFSTTVLSSYEPVSISFTNNLVEARVGWQHEGGGSGRLSAVANQFLATDQGTSGRSTVGLKFRNTSLTDSRGTLVASNQLLGYDYGIYLVASSADVLDTVLNSNILSDSDYAIYVLADAANIVGVSANDNVISDSTFGIRFGGVSCPDEVIENVSHSNNVFSNVTNELYGTSQIDSCP